MQDGGAAACRAQALEGRFPRTLQQLTQNTVVSLQAAQTGAGRPRVPPTPVWSPHYVRVSEVPTRRWEG